MVTNDDGNHDDSWYDTPEIVSIVDVFYLQHMTNSAIYDLRN